jgi:sugar-specific transcriptional regulator TrmB
MASEQLYNLLKIGLTEGEAKAYIALMELGSSTAGPIVKKSGIAYSNVYDVLNRLIEKGIVSFIIKDKTRHYQAVSPTNLVEYLEKKEKDIINQKESLKKALPELKKLQELMPKQEAEIFIGEKGLKTAYEKLSDNFSLDKEHLFLYIHEESYAKKADLFYFSIQEVLMNMKVRGISNEYGRNSEWNKQASFIKLRYVNFPIPGNIEVCGDKMLLISWAGQATGVLIHSKELVEDFRNYFESVWKVAKS